MLRRGHHALDKRGRVADTAPVTGWPANGKEVSAMSSDSGLGAGRAARVKFYLLMAAFALLKMTRLLYVIGGMAQPQAGAAGRPAAGGAGPIEASEDVWEFVGRDNRGSGHSPTRFLYWAKALFSEKTALARADRVPLKRTWASSTSDIVPTPAR